MFETSSASKVCLQPASYNKLCSYYLKWFWLCYKEILSTHSFIFSIYIFSCSRFLYTECSSSLFRLFMTRGLYHYLPKYIEFDINAKTVIVMNEYRLFSCMLYPGTNTLNQTEYFIVGENVSPDSVRTLTMPRVHNGKWLKSVCHVTGPLRAGQKHHWCYLLWTERKEKNIPMTANVGKLKMAHPNATSRQPIIRVLTPLRNGRKLFLYRPNLI